MPATHAERTARHRAREAASDAANMKLGEALRFYDELIARLTKQRETFL